MTTQAKKHITPVTKEQIIAAHTHSITRLMHEAAAAAAAAAQHAQKGEVNVAISYLLEIEQPLHTVAALKDAVLAFHRNQAAV